jgi:signal transduction histidine kinase
VTIPGRDLEVLVIAPVGRDSKLIRDALETAGLHAEEMSTIDAAIGLLAHHNVGALLTTEEVLNRTSVQRLSLELSKQPAWSDLPVLILTVGGSSTNLSRQREQDRLPLGSVTLLERPIRMATLVSSVRSSLRSRSRQYQVRDTLIERDLAEAARRETENRLLLAIETARLGTWERNLASGSLDASATCRRIFDWPADRVLTTKDLKERVHPEDWPLLSGKVAETASKRTPYMIEYRVLWGDGTLRWVSSSGRVLEPELEISAQSGFAAAPRLAGVTLDITERVLSEIALRNADKLALVGRLTSSIAHEINNPLEAVTNLLFLLGNGDIGKAEKEYVLTAQKELARVSEIASQTLTFNRQRDSHDNAILPDILTSVLALYQGRLATSNIEVFTRFTYYFPFSCYPGELRQVFTNLIANAFDATRRGGTILVRERLATHAVTGHAGVRVTIADTGSGMRQEVKVRIFEAFHSTKGNNGTGLGLWISKGIIEKHGGAVRFRTSIAEGRSGTVFSLFLPIATSEPKTSS